MIKYAKEPITASCKIAVHRTPNSELPAEGQHEWERAAIWGQVAPRVKSCAGIKLLDCVFFKAVLYSILLLLLFDHTNVIFIQQKIAWLSAIMTAKLTAVMGLLPTAVRIMPTLGMSFRKYVCAVGKSLMCCVHGLGVSSD